MSTTPGVTITGTLDAIAGAGNAGTVTFTLVNFGDLLPLVSGTALLSTITVVAQAASDGTFSQVLWGTYQISPANTFYQVTVKAADGSIIQSAGYQFNTAGSFDLSTLTPITTNPGLPVLAIIYPQSSGLTAHNWLNSYDATTGLFTHTQPGFSDLSGTIAASQLIAPTASTFGAVKSKAASSTLFITGLGTDGVFTTGQPAFTDISGTADASQIPNLNASKINAGQLALTQGGTGVDLSASGGTTKILAQDASHVISARDLVAGDIPSLAASKITSGQLSLARGGTAADLSATGGTSQVLKQTSVGGAVSVAQLAFTDISGSVAASQLPNPSASTLGGIESIAAVTHKWINSISTSGVPNLTQPSAADLSDTATVGHVLRGNGTSFVSAVLGVNDLSDGTTGAGAVVLANGPVFTGNPTFQSSTGSGAVVLATSPTLVTPVLGVASATSVNKLTITAPATGSTLTIADGKTLTVNNILTFVGTDSTTLTFQGTGTVVNRASTDTLTNKTVDTAGTGNHIQLAGVDLPASIGTNGQVLTNVSGTLAFTTVSGGGGGTPGGATNSIQYNDGAAFAGSMCLSPAGTLLPNASFKTSTQHFTSTGNSDLYTCPANKRAIITEISAFNGHASSSSTMVGMLKIGGVYYPASASTSVLAQNTGTRSITYVLEAGETIAINMTQQPFNVVVSIMEFDNTSNLKSAKLTTSTLTSGDNTVYTVPNGKSALVVNNTLTMCSGTQGTLTVGNDVGTIAYKWNIVASGGSPSTSNQMSASVTPASGTATSQTLTSFTMGAGDFISLNSSASTSNQIAFVTVVEV